jgi:chromosome segregation ATPase
MTCPESTTELLEKLRQQEETIASLKEKLRRQKAEYENEIERSYGTIAAMKENITWRRGLHDGLVDDNEKMTTKNEELKRLVDSLKSELAHRNEENERLTAELEKAKADLERYIDHHITSQENMSNHAREEKTALLEKIKQLKKQLADIQH